MYSYYLDKYGAVDALEYLPELAAKPEVQLLASMIKIHTEALENLIKQYEDNDDE